MSVRAFPGPAANPPIHVDHVRGDRTGLMFPAHAEALHEMGAPFLTAAFQAFGSLDAGNAVSRIVSLDPCPGGSTGAKLLMRLEYRYPQPGLPTDLFVKFSRDFGDPRRDDPGRFEMAAEVPFTWLTRDAAFPVRVPSPCFADYHSETGTGLIVTERIAYGEGAVEPHRRKTMDHETLADPVGHYRAVVRALARLCAAHKAGRLAPDADALFPFDPVSGSADPIAGSDDDLRAQLDSCGDFARACPQLLPDAVRSDQFIAKMTRDAWHIRRNEAAIQRYLTGNPNLIALCHWNAHIDNCFFVTPPGGTPECGFIDWGRVGQITFGSVLWGTLSAAHHDICDYHLDELLSVFVREYHDGGGPQISADDLRFHLTFHIAAMGIARVLAFPEIVRFRLPGCTQATGPLDPMFRDVDPARNCLHVYTVFLKFWHRADFGAAVDRLLAGTSDN